MRVMKDCGVRLERDAPDFEQVVQEDDTLISSPPTRIADILELVEWADRTSGLLHAVGARSPV